MTSNTQRFLIPKAKTRVVDPDSGKALPATGKSVRGNEIYWLRRLADGDVTEGPEPTVTAVRAKGRSMNKAETSSAAAKVSQE